MIKKIASSVFFAFVFTLLAPIQSASALDVPSGLSATGNRNGGYSEGSVTIAWTPVAGADNGYAIQTILNGSQVGATDTLAAQTNFVTSEFYFGARHTNTGVGPQDTMNNSNASLYPVFYQMRLYNKALSGAEITQNYNAVKGTYGL
jgi:hypothetical protein